MGRPLSVDLRERIVAAVDEGMSRRGAAKRFEVSESCAIKLVQLWKRTGSVAPARRGKKPFALAGHETLVRELVAAQPDITLEELQARLSTAGIAVAISSIWRFLDSLGLTLKKRRSTPPSRSGRTSLPRGSSGGRPRPS